MTTGFARAGLAILIAVGVVVVPLTSAARPVPAQTVVGQLDAVSCSSASSCFAVGRDRVVSTTDSGAHWAIVHSPAEVFDLDALSCRSATRCVIAGSDSHDMGRVYGTANGGATWQVLPAVAPGGLFLAISCASNTVCVATGSSGTVFTTADGGQTWTGQNLSGVTLINAIDCMTTTICQAVGYSGGNGVLGVALRTTDGGQHWVIHQMPAKVPFPVSVSCPTVNTCLTVGQRTIQSGRQIGVIAVTHDGGVSWRNQRVPDGYSNIGGISCPSLDVCEAGGYGPRGMLGTVDGGRTWTPQGPGNRVMAGVACSSTTICTAVGANNAGQGAIYHTDNGGRTWQHQLID